MDPISNHEPELENESVENVIDRNVDVEVESINPIHFEHQFMITNSHSNKDHVDLQETHHNDFSMQDTRNYFAHNIDGTIYFFPSGSSPYPIAQNIYDEVQY